MNTESNKNAFATNLQEKLVFPHAQSADEVLSLFNSNASGLTNEDASNRLLTYGKNALTTDRRPSLIARFFQQFKDLMVIVLLVAAAISSILSIVEGNYGDLIESGLILMIVLVNAVIGLIQESKAEASMEALKNLNKPFAKVLRNGSLCKISGEDVVPGDIVCIEAGDIIPADIRLIDNASLKIEEAALTGESVPIEKNATLLYKNEAPLGDRTNMCYSTGIVHYGRGSGVVVATGMNTEVGKIAKMLNEDDTTKTPLQVQLAKTAKVLSLLVLVIAVVIFVSSIIRSLLGGGITVETFGNAFMTAVAIAVAAIPEGLPAVVTVVLAIGVRRMNDQKAIIRNLPAVEALGCCEVICSDKTGTLTLNQMTVKELYTPLKGLYTTLESSQLESENLLRCITLCNDTQRTNDKLVGDPTETALIAYADSIGYSEFSEFKRVDENPFDSIRKLMTTINIVDGKPIAHIKGAPDILINKCCFISENNSIRPITDQDISKITAANAQMASKALRVLGAAIKTTDIDGMNAEESMIFVGLVGMIDPPRAEVADAVKKCRGAGMKPVMITGDHSITARAIAAEIGILTENGIVITGAELDKMSDEELQTKLSSVCVFARVSPSNKVRIVKAFQMSGKKVAMTGDGVNDAPGIKAADIGIGMGITGTDVSKGASDIVLADDNFATIINAVEEGRKIYNNIKKAVQYLLSANIAEVLCLFIATLFLNEQFLTPVMILWVNLITDSLPALALGMENSERNVMKYPPRKTNSGLLAGQTGKDILVQGILQSILVMTSFCLGRYVLAPDDQSIAMTMAFITLCFVQLFHSYNMRFPKNSLFSVNPIGNRFLNLSFLSCGALLLIVLLIPALGPALFGTSLASALGGAGWASALILSIGIIPLAEIQKLINSKILTSKSIIAN
ncbi:MAG: calcium-translocating P-type ATPase, PMCA-type [Christensenellaceae bacterium]|jgi:Ca2+-transporting ATPase|nr:calcium-translocating P-type ATPase, PMCA-type [Christensenellaceae bacterium]